MSMLDVKAYFVEVENQYKEMYQFLKDIENSGQENQISKENLEVIKENALVIKANYERLAYIMYLFNIPKSKKGKKKYNDKIVIQGADKQTVIDENTYVLNNIKKLLATPKEE